MKNSFRFAAIFLVVSFFKPCLVFAVSPISSLSSVSESSRGKSMTLSQIDSLIENLDYNAALLELASYMNENPEDFDRAQKRVLKILQARKNYNKKASELVELIGSDSGKKSEKLERIRELEKSESDATENYIDFTNLARRTVTLGELLVIYNKIMKEGVSLVHDEKYPEAAKKFEEGFELKNEKSDVVFEISDSENNLKNNEKDSDGKNSDSNAAKNDSENLDSNEKNLAPNAEKSDSGESDSDESDSKKSKSQKNAQNDDKERGILVVYESDITEPVRKAVESVKNLVASGFKPAEDECEKAFRKFSLAAESGNLKETRKAFENVKTAFKKFADLRNGVMAEARTLGKADETANARNPLLYGTSYITIYKNFVLGDEKIADSGIIGSMDSYFNSRVEQMKSKISVLVQKGFSEAKESFPENLIFGNSVYGFAGENGTGNGSNLNRSGDSIDSKDSAAKKSEAQKNLAYFTEFAETGENLERLYSLVQNYDGSFFNSDGENYSREMRLSKNLGAELLKSYENAEKIVSGKSEAESLLEKIESGENLQDVISLCLSKSAQYGKIAASSRESQGKIDSFSAGISENSWTKTYTAYFDSLSEKNILESEKLASEIWGKLAKTYYLEGEKSYADFEKRISEAENLLAGKTDESGFVKKYPFEAVRKSSALASEISEKRNFLVQGRKNLDGGKNFKVKNFAGKNQDYDSGISKLDNLINIYSALSLRNQKLAENAESEIKMFNFAFEEGKRQLNLAEDAFRRKDYDSANAAVERAAEKLAEALDYEYDETARKMREETLSSLASKILVAQSEQVIRDVFELKEKATEYYYATDFDSAETALVKAQVTWAKTNVEPDSEIEELLSLVRNVKSLSYGRVLLESDPHYPELSTSLDSARLGLEKGIALKKSGKKDEAAQAFSGAMANVRNVQNVYPLNKEARLLALRIQRETKPDGFPRQFENLYKSALASSDKKEQLADLQDLRDINPNYPGLSARIYSLEEELGLHPKKIAVPKPKKTVSVQIAEAKKQIENVTAILSQSDERLYAEAGRLFNQRKFSDANDMMEILWKSPVARRSRKVIDLRNRIARRL